MTRPELSFTDTHVHFYDTRAPRLRYSWLVPGGVDEEASVLGDYGAIRAERYWADDFLAETRFHHVDRIVHVQAALGIEDPVEETRWLQRFKGRLGVPHGVVAYARLAAPNVRELLERHLEFPIVRGIRDYAYDYDGRFTDPCWERGFSMLGDYGLVYCDAPPLEHADAAMELASRHPVVTFCIDHALMPLRRDPIYFQAWRKALRALAEVPNTVIKISGLGMCDHAWTVDSFRPWVLACIEAFGTERAFFGTNWPVDRLYSSYGDVLDAYAEIISGFSETERRALFHGNANRFFRLT